jgi:hypothetical protein
VTVVFFTVWRRWYGPLELGLIQGLAQLLTVLGSASGPLLFAEVHARTGSYVLLFLPLAAVALMLALLSASARQPILRTEPES